MSKQSGIELQDLSKPKRAAAVPEDNAGLNALKPESQLSALGVTEEDDGVMSAWAWTSAALIFLFASILTLFPRFLLFIGAAASEDERRNVLTPLESFLALHFGLLLYAIAATLALSIPSHSPVEQRQYGVEWHPVLAPLSLTSSVGAFAAYNASDVGALSFLVFLGYGVIGGFGLWSMAFAGSSRRSNKTGADKRTSTFLFGNKAAAAAQKKRWKKEHKDL